MYSLMRVIIRGGEESTQTYNLNTIYTLLYYNQSNNNKMSQNNNPEKYHVSWYEFQLIHWLAKFYKLVLKNLISQLDTN